VAATLTLMDALEIERVGDGQYRAQNVSGAGAQGVVFGGQLLAQSLIAASIGQEGKEVKTIHTVFARSASAEHPLELEVEATHSGRTFASATVTARQGERLCSRSLVLLSAPEQDLIRHAVPCPPVQPPSEAAPRGTESSAWEVRVVDDVDVNDPQATGPADLAVWTRFDVDRPDAITSQALLAYATDGFLIGSAMRPHQGVGQSLAHVTIATGVITHTLTFHEPFSASEWLLLAQSSPYAGRGRTYGRADVFTEDGRLVASFVQDGMVRDLPGSG
jgi:acyl-CoA thioesterase-2